MKVLARSLAVFMTILAMGIDAIAAPPSIGAPCPQGVLKAELRDLSTPSNLREFVGRLKNATQEEVSIIFLAGQKANGRIRSISEENDGVLIELIETNGNKHRVDVKELNLAASLELLRETQRTKRAVDLQKISPPREIKYDKIGRSKPMKVDFLNHQESLSAKHPSLISDIQAVETLNPDVEIFMRDFQDHFGKRPTVGQMIEFFLERKNLMQDELERLASIYERKGEPALAASFRNIRDLYQGMEKISAKADPEFHAQVFDPSKHEHSAKLSGYLATFYGHFGEMIAFAMLPRIKQTNADFRPSRLRGITKTEFENSMIQRIQEKTAELDGEFSRDSAARERFLKSYPALSRTIIEDETSMAIQVRRFLLNKEFDLVRESESGKTIWTEVKTLGHVIDGKLLNAPHGSKSIFQQAQEAVEMRRFLGLDQTVELELYSLSGVTLEAQEQLASIGVRVIGTIKP